MIFKNQLNRDFFGRKTLARVDSFILPEASDARNSRLPPLKRRAEVLELLLAASKHTQHAGLGQGIDLI